MEWKELLGFIGGALTTVGFIPQAWGLSRLRSAHEIGLLFTAFFIAGIGFWLSYGISMGLPSPIVWNGRTFALGWAMLCAKLRHGR